MPQSRTPTGPPTILPDLGRFLRETDPGFKDFTEKDDWELGRFLVETEPEFRDVVSYEGTAEALVGPLGRVNLQGPTPLPTGPAREVVAKQRTRIAEQTRAQELPPPRRPVIPEKDRTFSAGEKLLYSGRGPLNLPGEVLRGVTRGAAGVAQGFLGGVEPLTSATGDKSVPMAIGALDRYFESAAENDARLGIEPWKSPEWWAQKVGEVGGSVAGLAWAGGPFRAAGLEAFSEAGNAAIVNEKRYQLGEITKGQQLFDTVTTFLINAAVLGGTNAKLFEAALAAGPTYARVIKGAVSEGVLQETVQQLTSNVMTGKTSTDPNAVNARGESLYLFDGVPESLVVGAGAGAAFAGMRGPEAIREGVRPLVPPSPWSRVLRERAGLKQTSTPSQPPGPAPTAPAPPGAPPVVGKDYPAPPTPAAQGNLPYAAQQAPTLFGQPGTLGDQPVLGVDALANAEGAIRAGVAPGTRPAVLPEPTLVRGGLPQPVEAAPPPTLVFPPAGDLTTVTPEAAAAHRQATEQALQALPVELQAQARRMLDEGFVPQSVAPDGSIWATDTRPGREGKVAVFRPDPEPDQGITLRHLSVAERLGLGNLHAALSMLANGENPLETDLAPIQLLNQLGVLAPGETLLQGFSDYVEAIESLLLSDEASPQSDQAIALLRNWAVGSVPVVDPQLLGQTLPEMAAEVNLLQNTVAALPGDRLPGIQNRWQQAIAAMAPLPSQDVMIPWEGKKRRKTLAGVKLEEAQAIRANQTLSPTEKKDQLRRLMGLHTPAERATRMQEHRAKTKARLQRAAFELQPFGYEHPILRKERETMERAAETDPELNPHLYILRAVAERGGIHDVPKGEEGYEERSWMGEFAGGGGRVAGYKVLSRVGSKAERSRLKQAGNLRTLESIHHELEQADPYFETMDYSEFERKFIDALSWAANKGMSQRRMPRSRRRGRKGPVVTEVGAPPQEVTPAPSPDAPSVEKMRVGPSRKGSEPGQGKIRGGGASERGWRAMSRALYQGDPAEVATRESGVTPDPDAPIGSPERTEFAKQEISRILRSFISEAGAFNLEKAPALVKEITVYGAGLLARGVRNFPTWAKRMRQAFPYLRRVQIEAVWHALRRSGDDPARAAKVLQQATTPRERAALPQARKREVGMPPPSLANRAVTIGKRTTQNLVASMTEFGDLVQEILDLVDWSRIVRIVGNTDTRFRVFRQIATQILARPEFDPIVVEAGLATRQQLADHFVQLVSLQGLSLGRIGRAVQGNAKSIVLLDRAAARGITAERIQAGTLIPEGAIVSGDEILLPDGRRINKRMADKADSAFKDLLDSLVDPDTVSSNFGALADAVYHAFGSYLAQLGMEGTTDPLWDVLKETYDVSERVAGEAAIRKKAGSFLQDAHILGVAGMLSHLATAMRNLYTSGIRIPFQLVFSEGVAAAYAESRALIARDSARKALWARTARAHGSLARKGVALLFNASVLRNNPFPQRAWGDQLEEIYGLKQYLKEHPNDHSTRRSLYLLKGFPGRAANFLQYTMGAEDVDVGRIHAPMHRWMRRLQFFTRQQEFAVRGLIFDAAVRAEFARRGLSFADFTREIEEAQGAAEARGDREAAISPLHAQIIERYFGSEGGLQTLDDILAIAVGKALDLTFAGEGIPGGAVSNLLKVYQADAMLLVRMVSPFMRFVLNAGGHLYDQTLAGIEPILYWPQEKMTTALNVAQLRTAMKLERKAAAEEGRAPRSEEEVAENLPTRRPIGRYAKAIQSQTLEKGIPDARARLDEYRMRLARQMAALRQARIALRQAKAAQAKAQRAAAGPTPDFLTPSVQTTIPSTQFEEQQVAELEAEVARLKQTTRMLVNRLKKWTTQLERIHSAGISRDTAEFYGRVAMGGAMLSIALALVYLLQPDDEGREWYELQLPDPEGKPEWMKVTDLRSFAPYVSFLFMATMIKSFHRKTNWEQFWKDYDRLRQEYDARLPPLPDTLAGKVAAILEAPVHGFEKNRQALIEAFQMNYGGKYRAGKAWKESVEALIGISRQTGTQSFIMDIFFGGRPPEGGGEQLFHGLIGMAASFASRYTKPFGMLTDLQMIWDEEARIRRTAPRQPLNIPGGWTAPFQQILENIPGVREKIFESISPFTGKPREVETPILRQFTGFTIKEIAPVEREFRRLGMTPQEWGVKQTEIPWVDNHVAAHYHTLLTDVFLEQILPSDFYQGLSQNERRQFLTGTRTQSADRPGASITIPGILGDLKRVALYRATNDLAAERDVQRATTSARQAADFERWGRALVGLEAWTKMMHGEGMMSDEDEEETGEVIRPGPSSLVGVPPPSIQ